MGIAEFSEYWHQDFIRQCVEDLKTNNECYTWFYSDVVELKKITQIPLSVNKKDGYYTLIVPTKYRERKWVEVARFVYHTCGLTYFQIYDRYNICFSAYSKVNTRKYKPGKKFINNLLNMIVEMGYEVDGNNLKYKQSTMTLTLQEVEEIERFKAIKKSTQECELPNRPSPNQPTCENGL